MSEVKVDIDREFLENNLDLPNSVNRKTFKKADNALETFSGRTFKAIQDVADKPSGISQLGTLVYSNLRILSGFYETQDGNVIDYPDITFDTVLMSVSGSKNVKEEQIQGADGTFKEYIGQNDYTIDVQGAIVSPLGNYPYQQVKALLEVIKAPEAIELVSDFLQIFDIYTAVVMDYSFQQKEGLRNSQFFTITLKEDKPVELTLNE